MRKMLRILIFLGLVTLGTQAQCTSGCLKCSSAGRCILCDVTNQFVLSGASCILANLTNCKVPAQTGGCALCNASFYADPNTQKCVPVAVTKVSTNCAIYSSSQVCTECVNNFFLSRSSCVAINSTIASCLSYTPLQTCHQCTTGFVPASDGLSCVTIPSSSNCLSYTYVGCSNCTQGYLLDFNSYFSTFMTPSALIQWYTRSMLPISSSIQPLVACKATTVPNCSVFSSFNTCQQCLSGFFLQSNTCIANPLPVISGCIAYSSLTTCVQCQSGMHLSNSTSCIMNSNIANCALYNGAASTTTCALCWQGHFLQSNACSQRLVSVNITNCQTRQANADLCESCSVGFNLTADSKACLASIGNCAVYTSSTSQSSVLQCANCLNGYYLVSSGSSTSCVIGTLSNCLVYSSNTACSVCNNGFYLSNSLCVAHMTLSGCQVYSQTVANACQTCFSGSFVFSYATVCVSVVAKTNCNTYTSDGNTCTACAFGYYLSGGTCIVIPSPVSGCAVYNSAVCSQCNSGLMLNNLSPMAPSCSAPFDYILANCAALTNSSATIYTWTIPATTPVSCTACASRGITITPRKEEAVCVLTTQSVLFAASFAFSSIANCYRYGMSFVSPSVVVCMQCVSGYFISNYWMSLQNSTATTCVSTCVTTAAAVANTVILDDFFGFVNICVPTGAAAGQISNTNCRIWARKGAFNNGIAADYTCTLAATGSILAYTEFNNFMPLEIPGPTSLTSLGLLAGNAIGYHIGETNIRPSVFFHLNTANYTIIATPASSWFTNCQLAFTPNAAGTSALTATACFRCTFGQYTLTSGTAASSNQPTCVALNNCSGFRVGGLPAYLSAIASCHICNSNNGISLFPTVLFEYARDSAANDYNLIYQYSVRTTGSLLVFECAAAPATIIATNNQVTGGAGANAPAAPVNCAFYGVLTSVVNTAVNPVGNINNFCLSCATNYFPTYTTPGGVTYMPTYAISSCTAVPNCDTTVTVGPFNSCTRCTSNTSGPVPVYYAFTDSLLTNCQPSVTSNCLILISSPLPSTTTPNICMVCNAGYYLNADGFCESFTFPNVATSSTFTANFYGSFYDTFVASNSLTAGFDKIQVRIRYIHSFYSSPYGVSNGGSSPCQTGYTLCTPSYLAPTLCVLSTYIQNQTFPATGSKYVPRCTAYASPSTLLAFPSIVYPCVSCATSYIPTADFSSCVNSISNCFVAQSSPNTVLCSTCVSTAFNANGVCYNATISNCATYVNTPTSFGLTSLQCATCASGYSLSTTRTSCSIGSVANCVTYQSGSTTVCTGCTLGYTLITINATSYYCYPFTSSLNATALLSGTNSITGSNNGSIVATSCVQSGSNVFGLRQWSSLSTADMAQTICMPFTSVVNCANYSQSLPTISQNSFQCTECSSGFYLTASLTCVARTVNVAYCLVYTPTANTCQTCQNGFFLNSNSTNCTAFPSGLFGCTVYVGPSNCTQCAAPMYLSNGTCIASTVIPNCFVYSANNTCANCSIGYFLTSPTVCTATTALNCLTYASISACATCAQNFGLQTVGGSINCVTNILPNCINSTTVHPFSCLQCSSGYYPSSTGVCTLTTTNITNCMVYASATTCSVCAQNSVLSIEATVCNATAYASMLDPNCAQSFLQSLPQCSMCAFGFYFFNNACFACSSNTVSSGCLSCNPYDNAVCILCAPGFYQTSNGTCLKNSLGTTNATNGTNITRSTNSSTNVTLSGWRASNCVLGLLMGLVLIRLVN